MMASKTPNNNGAAQGANSDERKTRICDLSDERKARIRELLDRLHETPPVFEDESIAPEVDRKLLLSLARGELPEDQARLVYRLVYSFKSWCDAHTEVLTEEFHRSPK